MKECIYIIDDDPHILSYMREHLSINNFDVQAFRSPVKAIEALDEAPPALVISDVKMNEMTGDEVLNHVLREHPGVGVILITGFGNISHSVNAMRKGAFDYITKPFSGTEFISRVKRYFSKKSDNQAENLPARKATGPSGYDVSSRPSQRESFSASDRFVGEHPKVKKLLSILPQISPTSAPVMIQGESGTGKEVYASLIHRFSNRADQPYIKINCANLPSELVESTLFGHVKGAFTGAIEDREGAFKKADGGTLLLDEVTEIDINLQAKLLRVLQEKEFKKVGSQKTEKIDVRIISTTNRKIARAINEGYFRKDLYYRLNVFPIRIPMLSERIKDIPILAQHFIDRFTREFGLNEKSLSKELKKHLLRRDWEGNVRELENYIQRGVIMSQDEDEITLSHVENPIFENVNEELTREVMNDIPVLPIEEMELQMIKKALEKTDGNQKEAAKLLKVSDRTIRNKLKKIEFPDE
ncbi:sigma-54-dependent transcriptional regulator [Fodinibius sediminis]|uniref:DNA-binding transcriptional response regulator, NtrC family, contains REC, AAA-type ATPase, and a Fis-type DNA-binding domains n=1 Tax=Fodinibius sediminis TaxID=1214077 RepID=A0A521CJJ3_9BACT|nr:sigma-54 dependent transcriptional regulator [Fodinibius sediminis]SMO59627.1 DNA-binding transcriptional response regulator, NtrC family, contains REC, AAA-type ATPase, and a Fis-type DNA-binding domains [Fodinibius sediminis]